MIRWVSADEAKEYGKFEEICNIDYKVAIPYRDKDGVITGFILRRIDDGEPKYISTKGINKKDLFYYHKYKNADKVLLVEAPASAMYFTYHGIPTVAIGTAKLSKQHIEQLKNKIVVMALDEGNEPDVEKYCNEFYMKVIDSKLYGKPDDFAIKEGIEKFKALYDKAEDGIIWLFKKIYDSNDNTEAYKKLQDIFLKLKGHNIKLAKDFIRTMFELTDDSLQLLLEDEKKRKILDEAKIHTNTLIDAIKDGDLTKISECLKDNKIQSMMGEELLKRNIREEFISRIVRSVDGLKTGYRDIDEFITIPQGALTVIAGRPRHGKTTFMLNLCLNMMELYKE